MCAQKKVVIIGAGIGGVTVAAYLARAGYAVTVVEKNSTPGGRCGQLVCDGFRFDIGATLLMMPDVLKQTFTALGERLEDHLELRRMDPIYELHFSDGSTLDLSCDLATLRQQVEAIEPGSFAALLRYLSQGQHHYDEGMQQMMGRNFPSPGSFYTLSMLRLLWRVRVFRRHYPYCARFFRHPHLRTAFTFQNLYVGQDPFTAPATFSLLPYLELTEGVWFPIGGMHRIVSSLVTIAERNGTRFRYEAPVSQIRVGGDRAKGVVLADGERLDADLVVANADLPYVYHALLPDRDSAARLARMDYTCSAIVFYWGVKHTRDSASGALGHHSVFFGSDYRESFKRIFSEKALPDDPSFYVNIATRTDPTAAPADHDTVTVVVPVGHLDKSRLQDWDALVARARIRILQRLAAVGAIGLEQRIVSETVNTPRTWQAQLNLSRGATLGSLSHGLRQLGYLRPPNRHRRYPNLFFVGGSTHPGNGLPLTVLSARLTTERILGCAGPDDGHRGWGEAFGATLMQARKGPR